MNRFHRVILLVVLAVILLSLGYIITRQNRSELTPPQEESNQVDSLQEEAPTESPSTATQTVADPNDLYSVEIPTDWQVTFEEKKGVRLGGFIAQSPDYQLRLDETAEGPFTPVYYEKGASLQLTVTNEEETGKGKPAGVITQQNTVMVDGHHEATWYMYKEPSTAQGQLLEVRWSGHGKSFVIRLGYNPETFPQGPTFLQEVVNSFTATPHES